jgi:hypothetical protein
MGNDLEGSCGLNIKDLPWRDLLYSLSRKHPFDIQIQDGVFIVSEYRDRDR